MDTVDASAHYSQTIDEKPSLLVLILDTNPYAWSTLSATLPLERALASILIFLNAHMAFSHANRVAVIASHTKSARFLYPTTTTAAAAAASGGSGGGNSSNSEDPLRDANKYRQFRIIEDQVQASFAELMNQTTAGELVDAKETMMAGALGLALGYVNRLVRVDDGGVLGGKGGAGVGGKVGTTAAVAGAAGEVTSMNARILVVSVSGDLAEQYVPVMNSIFAAQRKKIPIDICKVAGETVFLQQASDTTRGIYMQLEHPESLLQYLMMCFIPDTATRRHLVPPTQINVDFRAACFCHKDVVDIGLVALEVGRGGLASLDVPHLYGTIPCVGRNPRAIFTKHGNRKLRKKKLPPLKTRLLEYLARGNVTCSILCTLLSANAHNRRLAGLYTVFCTPPEGAICTTCNTKLDISALGNFGGKPAVVLTKKKKAKKLKQSKATSFSNEASATSTPGTPAS
ncbi:unnamed protein product [Tuber aestivum]|uniref:General transcription and DNA repair factor IIH subunit TFB4 n=1 Tax=Tuber aestivum TaxID=59557 RepID=A0A292PTR2_9PEZI|nr:unnamed protein product [Tuber aestivum]